MKLHSLPPRGEDSAPHSAAITAELEALYRQHARLLWRVVGRLGVPPDAIEDVIHDTYMIACEKLDTIKRPDLARGWLCGVAVQVTRNRLSKQVRQERLHALIPQLPDPATPVEAVEQLQARALLDTLLAALTDQAREVFVLFEVEQLTGVEVAQALDIPVPTAHSRLRLARQQFATALAKWEERS